MKPKLFNPCPGCPNTLARHEATAIGPDEAVILIDSRTGVQYAVAEQGSFTARRGMITPVMLAESKPQFVRAVNDCQQPEVTLTPRAGFLGRWGLQDSEVSCPAIADQIGAVNAESVTAYFAPPENDSEQLTLY